MKIFKTVIITILLLSFFYIGNIYALEYFSIGGKPANPNPAIENSISWFIYNLDLGERKEDKVIVINNFDTDLDLLIYAADGIKSSSGGFAVKQYIEDKEEVGLWVTFYPDPVPEIFVDLFKENNESILQFCSIQLGEKYSTEENELFLQWCKGKEDVRINVKSKGEEYIKFVFSVPENASVGEHTGGIVIQKVEAETTSSKTGISLTTRVGIRIYQTVPGDIIEKLSIKNFSLKKLYEELQFERFFKKDLNPEEIQITTEIENKGNVSIDFAENISIKQTFPRKTETTTDGRNFQILREDTFISNYNWNNPRLGRFTIQNSISFTDINEEKQTVTSDVITLWIIPWREIIVVCVILFLLIIPIMIVKLIKRKKYSSKGWGEYTVQVGETLEDLSTRFDVNWKILAKVNKIEPPYILKLGQSILVPKKK